MTDAETTLTPKQALFAEKYLSCLNASQAAREAGYSLKTAHRIGQENMQKPAISQYISAKLQERQEKEKPLQQQILDELKAMAFFNQESITRIGEDGLPHLDMSKATRKDMAALTGLQTKTRKVYTPKGEHIATEVQSKVTVADKYRGLELLGKHLGMFKEAEQRVVVDVADRLLNARRRMNDLLPAPEEE